MWDPGHPIPLFICKQRGQMLSKSPWHQNLRVCSGGLKLGRSTQDTLPHIDPCSSLSGAFTLYQPSPVLPSPCHSHTQPYQEAATVQPGRWGTQAAREDEGGPVRTQLPPAPTSSFLPPVHPGQSYLLLSHPQGIDNRN